MIIGIGCTVPEIVNLPGQSGEAGVALDYSLASVCNGENAFSPSQATPSGGVFAATPSGLNINSSTGVVTPVGSTPQAYVITYTVSGVTSTFDLTIKPLDDASFSYSASSFPQNGSDPTPTGSFISGGLFSSTSGLIINTSTGKIDLSASTVGSYTVTYNTTPIGNVCPNTSNVSLAIGDASVAQINNVYSMEFDGTNDYIDIGLRPSLSGTEFTWSFWIYPTSTSGTRAIYSQSSSSANFQQTGYLAINGATLALDVWLTGTYSTGPNFVTLNEWQHIVATRDSSNIVRLYRNGVVFNSAGQAQSGGGPAANGAIGSWVASGITRGLYFGGKIDEGALFNVALTDSQILAIYNATAVVGGVNKTANLNALSTPPIKWYRMGD